MSEKACRQCRLISHGSVCPDCRTRNLSDDFSGLLIIFDLEQSALARAIEAKKQGRYALRVR